MGDLGLAHLSHLALQLSVRDAVVDVGDEDLAVVGRLDPDLGDLALVQLVRRCPGEVVGRVSERHLEGREDPRYSDFRQGKGNRRFFLPLFFGAARSKRRRKEALLNGGIRQVEKVTTFKRTL